MKRLGAFFSVSGVLWLFVSFHTFHATGAENQGRGDAEGPVFGYPRASGVTLNEGDKVHELLLKFIAFRDADQKRVTDSEEYKQGMRKRSLEAGYKNVFVYLSRAIYKSEETTLLRIKPALSLILAFTLIESRSERDA